MSRRYAFFAAASLFVLSACAARDFVVEKYTGERVGETVVGPRRVPILNQSMTRAAAPAAVPSPSAPAAASPKAMTPYDQYDNAGNDRSRTNVVAEWFGDRPQAPSAPSGRKSFKGLASVSEPVAAPPPVIRAAPPVVVPDENGVIVPLTGQQRSDVTVEDMQLAQLEPSAGVQEPLRYPHLSEVPRAPGRFKEMKAEKDANERQLQQDFDAAMEEKERIKEEPTELPPATLPQVEGMLKDIDVAIHGEVPIVTADAGAAR